MKKQDNKKQAAAAAICGKFPEYFHPYIHSLLARGILTDADFQPRQPRRTRQAAIVQEEAPQYALPQLPTVFPGGITADTLFDHRTERIIKAKAYELVCTGAFQPFEEDDLRQELRIALWREMPKFNPSIPGACRYTFAATVTANRGKNMLSRRNLEIARGMMPSSLNVPVGDGEETLLDLIPEDEGGPCCGHRMGHVRRIMLDEAFSQFLDALDTCCQDICVLIMLGFSQREIDEKLNVPRATVQFILAKDIRRKALEAGLDDLMGGAR